MMKRRPKLHHTKTKADIGLAKVIADLTLKGMVPCVPLSEHQPYDLVVVGAGERILRLQVKYATLKQGSSVEVRFRRSWADKKGSHVQPYGKNEFDYYAIYCPQKEVVLYVPNSGNAPKVIRFTEARNGQAEKVHWFGDYLIL